MYKEFLTRKNILALLGLLLVAVTLPLAGILVKQSQEVRKEAAACPATSYVSFTKNIDGVDQPVTSAVTNDIVKAHVYLTGNIDAADIVLSEPALLEVTNAGAGTNFSTADSAGLARWLFTIKKDPPPAATAVSGEIAVITFKVVAPVGTPATAQIVYDAKTTIALNGSAGGAECGTKATLALNSAPTPSVTTPTNTPVPGQPTPTPGAGGCSAVGKVITVTPVGGLGTCHDLQKAIDAVPGGQYTINLAAGNYVIPDSGDSFSIKILNKNDLTIQGDPQAGSKAVKLSFLGNRGGISVQGSSGSLEWMEISGRTSNGIVYINESPRFSLRYTHISDETANAVQINRSADNTIVNSEIKSSAVAIYLSNTYGATIANNFIHDSSQGIESNSSGAEILSNLFSANRDVAIYLIDPYGFSIARNTIVGTNGVDRAAVYLDFPNDNTKISFNKNIVASNSKGGVELRNANKGNYFFELNDVWNNSGKNYIGIADQAGKNGNISADPLFGSDFCLETGSPAIYGDVSKSEYMGHIGSCGGVTPTGGAGLVKVSFKVKFAGVEQQRPAQQVRVVIKSQNGTRGQDLGQVTVTSDSAGVYQSSLITLSSNITSGFYRFVVKGPKHLATRFCANVGQNRPCGSASTSYVQLQNGDNALNFSTYPLLAGDLPPQDGVVNSMDAVALVTCLVSGTPDSQACVNKADLNFDGIVNTMDMNIMNNTIYTRWEDDWNE